LQCELRHSISPVGVSCFDGRLEALRGGLEGERKQVTVLFADLTGSTELLADRDPGICSTPSSSA